MALFTAMGLGAMGSKTASRTTASTAPAPSGQTTSGGRRRPESAPVIGTAVARGTSTIGGTEPTGPPVPGDITSAAGIAALRARRRGVGSSVLTGLTEGAGPVGSRLERKTLKPAGSVLG
jgi:hypothetical protein